MERPGYQLDGATRNEIIIMPFLTSAATDTGYLPQELVQLVADILTTVRLALDAGGIELQRRDRLFRVLSRPRA